jgi:SAM-dependent methyltransferase
MKAGTKTEPRMPSPLPTLRKLAGTAARSILPVPVQALILPSRGVLSLTRDTWEQEYASGYWERMDVLPELGRYSIIAGYCNFLKPQGSILDIGCGKGLLAKRLSRGLDTLYLGVDLSTFAIDQARAANLLSTQFIAANATTFRTATPVRHHRLQ